ncbi:ABC-F family ATP-binding cassette domain-containing protein [Vibrio scophthalmi]|uniref:ABC-F family ATP-binding cassette domain-containing protein n=1 Tax=Vibrio scophthalmi TaxID=45658 RepID=UPI002FEFCB48
MPFLQASSVSYQFNNGERLFDSLTFSMTKSRVGLVGRNGVGKSMLASILLGEVAPSSGHVMSPQKTAIYRQQGGGLVSGELTIAQFLGKHAIFEALERIENGECDTQWFEQVGDEWDLPQRLSEQLVLLGLPPQPQMLCAQLSGGQLARLQLWQLFESQAELLILDEPSNHLDIKAKRWLIEQIRQYSGAVFVISHDRSLLREMDEIWALSSLGMNIYGGNYDHYAEQQRVEQSAVERQLSHLKKQQKQLKEEAQRNREKAEQRAAQGNRLRRSGSQPKILLDGKKDKATARASNRNKNEQQRQTYLDETQQALTSRYEENRAQTFYLTETKGRDKSVVMMENGVLAYGRSEPLTLRLTANNKVRLVGDNGCGKSTLLKTLLGECALREGQLRINTEFYYLDQHFAALKGDRSMLDNLLTQCQGMTEMKARTLLAGVGFRRDTVFRLADVLSGGEKMKLAMLIVSHQLNQPFLLLDEPDNHLDLDSKQDLSRALNEYPGGFLLVTHDDDFASDAGVEWQIGE